MLEENLNANHTCGIVVYNPDTYSVSLVYLVLLHPGCQHPEKAMEIKPNFTQFTLAPKFNQTKV